MKVSDFIALKIKNLGIKDVPVFQGGAIMHIIDSIGKLKGLNYYCPYHEQSMAMSVDCYSRLKSFGIGCVTSGPGATNLITGVCCSYYDSIPCLFITGQVGQFHIKKNKLHRQKGFQETDVKELFSSITKFSYQIKNAEEVDYILDKAIYIAKTGRPGPVIIDIPYNIQTSKINVKNLKKFTPKKIILNKEKINKDIRMLIKNIYNHKKVVFICGGGVPISKNNKNFLSLVKKIQVPFVTTWSSQDITPYDNKLYIGSIGRHGNQSANETINNADLIITFGFRFAPKAISENFRSNLKIKIISLDIDKIELAESIVKTDKKINLDLSYFFKLVKKIKLKKLDNKDWVDQCLKIKKIKFLNNLEDKNKDKKALVNPYLFFHKLSFMIKKDAVLITDAGANLSWCMMSFKITNKQRLISAWGNSPMGYSISGGIGAAYATKNKQIISCIGDGSFMINVQELQFLKHHKNINLNIIVFDNETLGNTKLGTEEAFNGRTHGNDKKHGYYPPDIKKIANSFSLKYFYLNKNKNINDVIKKFLKNNGNKILHVKISSEHNVIDHSKKELNSIYFFNKKDIKLNN